LGLGDFSALLDCLKNIIYDNNDCMRLTIREYVAPQGKNPFREWLKNLDMRIQARVQARVLRFESGNLGDHKNLWDGVWEARLDFGPGYRLYFARDGNAVILLLAGGDNASQSKDVTAAKRYWQDFRETKHGKAQ
jgi:putative addiction module killer protein